MRTEIIILVWVKRLALMMAMLALFACDGPEVNDQQIVQTAREYLEQNKIREASIELKNALQGNPGNAEARYLLGMINLDKGDAASAEKEFRRAVDAGWPEGQARIGQARAMISRKAFKKILDEVKVKDSYSANSRADLHALHALAQAGLGEMRQARDSLEKASQIDSNSFHVLKSTIQIQLAMGEVENAGEGLIQALEVYPDNQEILLLSATMALGNKDLPAATAAYQKVVELDPVKWVSIYGRQARLALARLEILDGNLDQAQATIMPLINRKTNDPETNFVAGLLAFEQGDLNLAEERLLVVLNVAPEHTQTQLLFGNVKYAQQDYEQAAYYIAKYVSTVPGNLGARKLLGRTYIKLGQHEEAQVTLQPGLQDRGDDAELLALVGLSQLQAGNTESGIDGLEKAVKAAPEGAGLRSELAKAYISAGETENAIKQLNTILAKGGNKKQTEALLIAAHIRAEQYDQAIDAVLEMVKQSPEDPSVLALAGNVFAVSNDRIEARKYFNKALQIKTDYAPAAMLLAKLEEIEGHPAEAEALYKKLADANKEDITALLALARLAETQNQTEKMLEWLEYARDRAPQDIKSRKILVEYYLREKQLKKAKMMVKEVLKIAPQDNTLIALQARLQMAEGQYNKALLSLNGLVTSLPDSILARTLLAETYIKIDQQIDASRQLRVVLEKEPNYIPALMLMAKLELRAGKHENALLHANKIQKIQPDLHVGYELAGDVSMAKKNYPDAKASYEEAWQRKQIAGLAIKLSEVSMRSGEFKEADKYLRIWLSDNPDDARVLQSLGMAYMSMKLNGKSIEVFEKLLVIQPDNAVVLNNLAWLYSLTNNPKALELAERAFRLSSKDSGVQDTYGWILVQQGQVDKGRQLLEQVMKSLSAVPEVQYHYAVALLKSGEEKEARKILGKLLEDPHTFEGREVAEQLMR